ncbi:MAG: DUF6491 family protein [Pseudomonas sp.]|uniref:DUF6491 family protein n=1 Tax=Pseudomonas sp. TaxID=306 RepID=UPI00299EEA79|nr:DUF6491 family protein [Pseudomonas sp.]MDX1721948.1 DUF6491 family protein [Pseudomonas sp.]
MQTENLGHPVVSALLLAACSQQPLRDESLRWEERLATLGYHQGEPVKSVWYVDVHAWQYLDKPHMVLGSGRDALIWLAISTGWKSCRGSRQRPVEPVSEKALSRLRGCRDLPMKRDC